MEKNSFISMVCEKLQEISTERKDAWILEQAKLVLESAQQDFLMSLTGEKKITYMPTETEIDEFCKKVQEGEICVEYETHYYEFNSEGRYVDNWEIWHNDPKNAFAFLDRTFRGCHDLLRLGEYKLARKILDRICRLEFQVVEARDSEDFEDDSPFTIKDAGKEQKLSMSVYEIGYDWVEALLLDKEDENLEFAENLLKVLKNELCQEMSLSDFTGLFSEKLLDHVEGILEKEIEEMDEVLKECSRDSRSWQKQYIIKKLKARSEHLLLDIRKKCREQEKKAEMSNKVSVLKASWKQIDELFCILSYERYIDDQLEIDEVWNICQALIKRGKFEEEDWKLRKKILSEMIAHDYYDCYGCYDPIKELSEKLYITDEEVLEFADLLNKYERYAENAAEIYRKYGKMDKYILYLETHLGKTAKEYIGLIQCYCDAGNEAGAREIAERGLKQCKDDLMELFIFLLKDAKASGDEERYKRFYASAKRRQKADIRRVDAAITESQMPASSHLARCPQE